MHVAWSCCQAAGVVDKRKTNQMEKFKKEESAGTQINLNKNKWNVQRMFSFMKISSLKVPSRPTDASPSFPLHRSTVPSPNRHIGH